MASGHASLFPPTPWLSVGWHTCSPLLASTRLRHGNLWALLVWLRLPQSCTPWVSCYPGVQPSLSFHRCQTHPTVWRLALPFSHPFPSQALLSDALWLCLGICFPEDPTSNPSPPICTWVRHEQRKTLNVLNCWNIRVLFVTAIRLHQVNILNHLLWNFWNIKKSKHLGNY